MAARILVVDDEPGILSGVGEILTLEGYEVDTADCGRRAQELITQQPYDVALIDYRLPDVDGLTLLRSIRQRCPEVMTCMITAYANIETAVFATRQGVDLFLPKPFSPDDLLGAVDTLLGYKKLRDEAGELRAAHAASLRELASEKSQTHSLVASLRDGVLAVNREGEIVLANRAMEEMLGAAAGELLGRQVGPALGGGVLAPAVAALDPQNPAPAVFEAERGERRLFVTVSGFYDDEGAMLGRIVTAVDISSVRRMALEKARFTRTLVHELRAPLGALKSIVEGMRDRSRGTTSGPTSPSWTAPMSGATASGNSFPTSCRSRASNTREPPGDPTLPPTPRPSSARWSSSGATGPRRGRSASRSISRPNSPPARFRPTTCAPS
jgi:DNA-binding response OmpR family regulator